MTKQQFIKEYVLTEKQFLGLEEYIGSLDLRSVTSIPEGFNPTVGGSLYLDSVTSMPEGFNPTVGGSLNLRSVTSIPEGFNKENHQFQEIPIMSWQNGKYISVDGIFCEVIKKRGNVYKCKKLYKKETFYIVTDGNKYAHGETVKEAKEDLIYKITNRSKEDFKHLKKTSKLPFEKMIECYRVVTGACGFGVKDFVKSNSIEEKEYSIKEVIGLTKNSYGGSTFANFFNS